MLHFKFCIIIFSLNYFELAYSIADVVQSINKGEQKLIIFQILDERTEDVFFWAEAIHRKSDDFQIESCVFTGKILFTKFSIFFFGIFQAFVYDLSIEPTVRNENKRYWH